MRRWLPATTAVLLGAALLAACGDSDSKAPETHRAPAAERTRFIVAADPICRAAVKQIQGLEIPASGNSGTNPNPLTPVTEGYVRPGVSILTEEADRLRAIEPRPDDFDLQRYLGLFDPIVVLSEQRLRLGEAKRPDLAAAQSIENDVAGIEDAQSAYAKSFGFKVCGSGFFDAIAPNPNE